MAEGMFWADQIARGASGAQVVNDSKTPSGKVHVGALRGVLIHDVIYKALKDAGVKAAFYYGEDDYDPMDSLPVYLDKQKYAEHMGKPLSEIPAPDGSNRSYADFYMQDFREVYEKLGA
ncbi:MAG: lysine--tRNA ligase, partial [Candidatus Micrarchaeota archaeon]